MRKRMIITLLGVSAQILVFMLAFSYYDYRQQQSLPSVVSVVSKTIPHPTTTTTVEDSYSPVSSYQITTTTTTTTTVPVAKNALCGQWWQEAYDSGWPADLLPVLDSIIYQESRCIVDAIGDGSFGLIQIQWNVHDEWILEYGFTKDDMLYPLPNLKVGWLLYQKAESMYGCGFQPWYMSGDWC